MYVHVQFGVGQSRIFNVDVRSQQLMSHIKASCAGEFRRTIAGMSAKMLQEQGVAEARMEKLQEYIAMTANREESAIAEAEAAKAAAEEAAQAAAAAGGGGGGDGEGEDGEGAGGDDAAAIAAANASEAAAAAEAVTEQLQQLREELTTLEEEGVQRTFMQEKIAQSQAVLEADEPGDLFCNGNLMFLEQGGDRYATEPPEKGAVSAALEPKQTYVLFLGEQPLLLPQNEDEEAAFAAKYKPKNLPKK